MKYFKNVDRQIYDRQMVNRQGYVKEAQDQTERTLNSQTGANEQQSE